MKNSNKKISFDFDDVIADTSRTFLDILHRDHGYHDFTYDQWTNFKVAKCSNIPVQIIIDIFDDLFENSSKIQPIQSSIEFLNSLDTCLIVTARKTTKPVEDWLNMYVDNKHLDLEIIATGTHNKLEDLKRLKVDMHVDDRFETYSDLVLNTSCVPVLFERPWNKLHGVKNKIQQLNELEDILNKLEMSKEPQRIR